MHFRGIRLIIDITAIICCLVIISTYGNSNGNGGVLCLAKDPASTTPKPDDCDKCGPTRMIGCRRGRCYYKCTRRCLGKDNKFYYEALKFNFAGQR